MPHSPSRPSRAARARRLLWAALALAAALAPAARAQSEAGQELSAIGQRWLDKTLAQTQGGALPLRMEVSGGALDPRLRLAPCARVEPYLPAGARLCHQLGGRGQTVLAIDGMRV